jgi:hypothetical protein
VKESAGHELRNKITKLGVQLWRCASTCCDYDSPEEEGTVGEDRRWDQVDVQNRKQWMVSEVVSLYENQAMVENKFRVVLTLETDHRPGKSQVPSWPAGRWLHRCPKGACLPGDEDRSCQMLAALKESLSRRVASGYWACHAFVGAIP